MITYKDAGVDVKRGYEAVRLMKEHVKTTFDANVLGDLGSFGGFYAIDRLSVDKPVLVAGTDGVGTKLKIAFLMDKHDTIGIDCVAMSVNDIICQGAKPLFFLDYLATARISPEVAGDIVKGIAEGCRMAGCALIGGETAEMPDFYAPGEYDLAGFCVGIVGRDSVINGKGIEKGDALIGLASSGPHSNGFSLIRKLLLPSGKSNNYGAENDGDAGNAAMENEDKAALAAYVPELGQTLGEALLTPTRLYAKTVLELIRRVPIKGIANITGGGFIENIPRILPEGLCAVVDKASYPLPPLFTMLKDAGNMTDEAIYNTFNMGIGMVLCVGQQYAQALVSEATALGQDAYVIGVVDNVDTVDAVGTADGEKVERVVLK